MPNWNQETFAEKALDIFEDRFVECIKNWTNVLCRIDMTGMSIRSPLIWFLRRFYANIAYYVYDSRIRNPRDLAVRDTLFDLIRDFPKDEDNDCVRLDHVPGPAARGSHGLKKLTAVRNDNSTKALLQQMKILSPKKDGIDFTSSFARAFPKPSGDKSRSDA